MSLQVGVDLRLGRLLGVRTEDGKQLPGARTAGRRCQGTITPDRRCGDENELGKQVLEEGAGKIGRDLADVLAGLRHDDLVELLPGDLVATDNGQRRSSQAAGE